MIYGVPFLLYLQQGELVRLPLITFAFQQLFPAALLWFLVVRNLLRGVLRMLQPFTPLVVAPVGVAAWAFDRFSLPAEECAAATALGPLHNSLCRRFTAVPCLLLLVAEDEP